VKFIFSHGGGALSYMIGRLTGQQATCLQGGGTLRRAAPAPRTNPQFPKGALYELQKFYYDTASAVNPIAVGGLRKMVPTSPIMFGADFRFVNSAEQLRLLKECGVFNAKELQAIYCENAGMLLPRAKA
jgi:6-methylsalicylate decarboxylase